MTALVRPVTRTGVLFGSVEVEPLPNSPSPLVPQHITLPSESRAQVWPLPAEIALTGPVPERGLEVTTAVAAPACVDASAPTAVGAPGFDGAAFGPQAARTRVAAPSRATTFDVRARI